MVKMCRNIVLIWIGFIVSACGAIPITDGAHSSLPEAGSVVIVWSSHPVVTDTMSIWLHKQGLVPIERNWLEQILKDQDVILSNSDDDQVIIIESAKKMHIDLVVFGDLDQEIRAPMVSIRGFNVDSNRVLWEGSAHYDQYIKVPLNHALVDLTCQALATAWGLRERGKSWFRTSGDICLTDSK
ncbi:hypothetical protein Noc_1425 [Nitrosococcus oceani ATCC 19707]|uniref:Lipoprotein n=2 Tax=Nitrosococcus oceani TaxID=1229 RepID=Q3JB82_NITOC|nr:hypothetical protein Noc_1425 [Nitrosococcus oceani ATCC 19707]KFI19642.1 hypothetical protein IB75_07455 [Nitrosococcus oceani C-27]